ncbi:response regulator [uncultured Draconibacterium sp.]|uniref:response regulator n=1 Tax=uncultured Draconibacterium sp. TaxID=1573823 RepID=UPI00374A62E5
MVLEVDKTFNGKDGLMKARNNHFRFILLDLRLQLMDGFEICKRLRKEKMNTPIFLTESRN